MDQTWSGSSPVFVHQHCTFPTISRASGKNSSYKTVKTFDDDHIPGRRGRGNAELENGLLSIWAILLRFYAGHDSVAFLSIAPIRDDLPKDVIKDAESQGASQYSSIHMCYDIPDHIRSCDVKVASTASHKSGNKDATVNTAVAFSKPPSSDPAQLARVIRDVLLAERHQLDLILHVTNEFSSISLLYYEPSVSDEYALSIARNLKGMIRSFFVDGERRVGQLDFVCETDKQLMRGWNPPNPFTAEKRKCMHELVEAKAQAIPDAEAICAWDGTLTCMELNALSDIVARRLNQMGVRPGMYVPFAYEKSMWTVVATLAILKAGGAFVPLNPRDPSERLAEISQTVNARVIATSTAFVSRFESLLGNVAVVSAEAICLGARNGWCHDGSSTNTDIATSQRLVTPEDAIFVLFTSGSTGRPKGMIHTHASICTHALAHGEAMAYDSARVLQFAAHTFDVAIMDMFTTLLFGGCICIPSEEDRCTNITDFINEMHVDHAILTPSFAGLIEPSDVPTLETLAIGGEALPQDRIERWADKVRFIQIYGPAEVGICLTKNMDAVTRPDNVGFPLCNSSCWLVDPEHSDRLVPIGAVGELIVAGPSLAQGYVNDEAKTQLSFIDAPSWARSLGLLYQRFYRTGDLLKYDVCAFDGSYVFVGRKDAQIKLRGQRIEPGEVEYHLGRLPGVSVSMVARPTEGHWAGKLLAVVQMQQVSGERVRVKHTPIRLAHVQTLSVETVREELAKVLPGYMIPTTCLVVENMPFVPSLKIDRRQVNTWLAHLEPDVLEARLSILEELDEQEVTANALSLDIAKVLGRDNDEKYAMLVNHDYVLQETGIDSVQVIALSMYLQRCYNIKVPLSVLLSSSTTIRHVARLLDKAASDGNASLLADPRSLDLLQEARSLSSALLTTISPLEPTTLCPDSRLPIRNVLLTGSTGYLGIAILERLLATPSINVYVLIRCSSSTVGLTKIITAARPHGWWREEYAARLYIWPGDLTLPCLGLRTDELRILRGKGCGWDESIHAIIHNGAKVHYSSDYTSLEAVNVLSTIELMKIAAEAPHISQFVFVSGGEKPSIDTSCVEIGITYLERLFQAGGYMQSKFVCEQVIQDCAAHPAFETKKLRVVKPGYIIGSRRNGIANPKDFIWRLVAGCLEIGAYNEDEARHWLYIASVDCVASHVVGVLFIRDDEGLHTERVLAGLRFADLWTVIEEVYMCRLEALPATEWLRRLRLRVMDVGESHLLFPLLEVLERDGENIGEGKATLGVGFDKGMHEDATAVIKRNLEYLIDDGFLPLPRQGYTRMRSSPAIMA
ncbi:MAG: hypothetical protein Q9196_000697 [Gyalolechia fulgens]